MEDKVKKIIARILLTTLLATRVFFAVPAVAFEVPTIPAPPPLEQSAPALPTVPPPPANPPTSSPNNSGSTSAVVPTVPVMPTAPVVPPTNQPAPTSESTLTPGDSSTPTLGLNGDGTTIEGTTGENPAGNLGVTDTSQTPQGSYDSNNPTVNDPANIATGPGSQNTATETVEQKLETMNKNLAEMNNKLSQISSTGFNYANLNTLDGQVFTGNSASTLNLLNKLNSNMTGLGGFAVFNVYDTYLGDIAFQMADGNVTGSFGTAAPTISKNVETGPFSSNIADASNTFTVKEANGNDAYLTNDITLQAVTGGNSASMNTGNGIVKTGDALAVGNIVNLTNTNINAANWLFGVVNIFGTLAGNILLPQDSNTGNTNTIAAAPVLSENQATGAFSQNSANFTNSANLTTTNDNVADINTTLDVSANTGNNASSINTGGGYVQTGSSETAVSNSTIANVNTDKEDDTVWMVIVNEMGKWVGHIIGAPWGSTVASNALPISQTVTTGVPAGTLVDNTLTGAYSTNESTYVSSTSATFENQNTAKINNNINVLADTGNNQSSYNTGAGVIETGNAKAGLNLVNIANTNITAKKFIAILVNVMGSFLGDVVTPGQQTQLATVVPSPTKIPTPTIASSGQTGVTNPTPTPTTYQTPVFTATSGGIGGVGDTIGSDTQYLEQGTVGNSIYYTYQYPDNGGYAYQPDIYTQAYKQVYYQKLNVSKKAKTFAAGNVPVTYSAVDQAKLKRGLFLSPTFAKATETSFAGILLSGFKWKVDQNWLSIIPFALIFVYLRRRRTTTLGKFIHLVNINSLLEVLL